jgi:hypothetical protein
LNRGGLSPGPKKAITSQRQTKPEPCWVKTWPQKDDYKPTTKLNRDGRKHGPKKAMGVTWGDEKEVPLVSKLDPIFIPLQIYYFKNNKLTIL